LTEFSLADIWKRPIRQTNGQIATDWSHLGSFLKEVKYYQIGQGTCAQNRNDGNWKLFPEIKV
jgi:hypothetical protein